MAEMVRDCKIFIASPGDLDKERQIVGSVCVQLNKTPLVRDKKIRLIPVGWDIAIAETSNPREIWYKLATDYKIVICLYYKRFGTHTQKAESGNPEEIINSYIRWEEIEKPDIFLYFKHINHISLEDLGDEELRKVLTLKEKVKSKKSIQLKEFDTPESFETVLTDHLKEWVFSLSPPRGEGKQAAPARMYFESPADQFQNILEKLKGLKAELDSPIINKSGAENHSKEKKTIDDKGGEIRFELHKYIKKVRRNLDEINQKHHASEAGAGDFIVGLLDYLEKLQDGTPAGAKINVRGTDVSGMDIKLKIEYLREKLAGGEGLYEAVMKRYCTGIKDFEGELTLDIIIRFLEHMKKMCTFLPSADIQKGLENKIGKLIERL